MNSTAEPEYPLTIRFADGETVVVETPEEAECDLEWLDTDDEEDPVVVTDKLGRRVHLKVEQLRLVRCELAGRDEPV